MMTPHLRQHVRAYVDRALPPAMLHLYDRHVVCCTTCRAEADQERRIVAALRADTGVPMSLRSSLMGLASLPAVTEPEPAGGARIPLPPIGFRMPSAPSYEPVPTVSPTAPALHRSPMRAAVVASLAAGASVAAAWGLAVSPVSSGTSTSVRVPAASFGAGSAGQPGSSGAAGSVSPVSQVVSPYWVVGNGASTRAGDMGRMRVSPVSSAESAP